MYRLVSLLICLLLSLVLLPIMAMSADDKPFLVSSFIPDHFTDRMLRVNGRLYLSSQDAENENNYFPGASYTNNTSESDNSSRRFTFGSDYSYLKETIPRTVSLRLSFNEYMNHNSTTGFHQSDFANGGYHRSNQKSQTTSYDTRPAIDLLVQQYLADNWFAQFTGSNYLYYYYTPTSTRNDVSYDLRVLGDSTQITNHTYDYESSYAHLQNNATCELKLGFGRAYEGSFASTALSMIAVLRDHGMLTSEPTADQMLALTEIIYHYRQTHTVDSRMLLQEALDQITSYLKTENIAADLSPAGHFAVHDVWVYYPNRVSFPRKFGWQAYLGLGVQTLYEHRHTDGYRRTYTLEMTYHNDTPDQPDTLQFLDTVYSNNSHRDETDTSPYLMAGIDYYYPVNHLWQINSSLRTQLALKNSEYLDYRTYGSIKSHLVSGEVEAIRLLDSRTTVQGSLAASYRAEENESNYPDSRKDWQTYLMIDLNLAVNYRIAIPTTLDFQVTYRMNNDSRPMYAYDDDSDSNNFSIQAGLTHYLY